jgi:hypothetical protein
LGFGAFGFFTVLAFGHFALGAFFARLAFFGRLLFLGMAFFCVACFPFAPGFIASLSHPGVATVCAPATAGAANIRMTASRRSRTTLAR